MSDWEEIAAVTTIHAYWDSRSRWTITNVKQWCGIISISSAPF